MSVASVTTGAVVVSYTNANAVISLDYNSKNQKFRDDTATATDAKALTYALNIINAVYASDLRWPDYSGCLNGAPFNIHAILLDGSLQPKTHEDVTITVT